MVFTAFYYIYIGLTVHTVYSHSIVYWYRGPGLVV